MKKCLVTGSTGFVGSRLVKYLDTLNYDICLLSRKPNKSYKTFLCDFEKEQIPLSALEKVETVFHVAGIAHDVKEESKFEHIYQTVNVDATIQLATLAVNKSVKSFVFVSSVKAGGPVIIDKCMTEENQAEPDTIYGKSKREAEIKLLKIGEQSRMHVSILRSSLIYGPGMKGNLKLMQSAIKNGWFPSLPHKKNRRSLIHVDDFVRALLFVANQDQANGEIFIATDGRPYSSREIYETMCQVLRKKIPKWHFPKFLFDLAAFISPNIRYKIEKLLGDEYYSSEKLHLLGFNAQQTLNEMDETFF